MVTRGGEEAEAEAEMGSCFMDMKKFQKLVVQQCAYS